MTRRDWLSGAGTLLIGEDLAGGVGLSAQTVARPATVPNTHVRLSLNENAFGCSPLAVEAIRRGLTDLARYTESDAQLLTTQIAAKEGVLPAYGHRIVSPQTDAAPVIESVEIRCE
jgi:histidinol-phosphate aminotransferase